jgi:hypothetical protein
VTGAVHLPALKNRVDGPCRPLRITSGDREVAPLGGVCHDDCHESCGRSAWSRPLRAEGSHELVHDWSGKFYADLGQAVSHLITDWLQRSPYLMASNTTAPGGEKTWGGVVH